MFIITILILIIHVCSDRLYYSYSLFNSTCIGSFTFVVTCYISQHHWYYETFPVTTMFGLFVIWIKKYLRTPKVWPEAVN